MELLGNLQTIEQNVELENTVRKSRFIALTQAIEKETEARAFIKSVYQRYPDGTHHCWAFRLGTGKNEIVQYSDSGEPANSAGPPILQAIKQEEVTNLIVLVVRYYGGIKLGISGLIKAYRDTARLALQKAGKKIKIFAQEILLEGIEYKSLGAILQSVESKSGKIVDIKYGENVGLLILIPRKELKWFNKIVNNITQGKVIINKGETKWIDN